MTVSADMRLPMHGRQRGGIMRLLSLAASLLALLSVSVVGHAQTTDSGSAPPSDKPATAARSASSLPDVIVFESELGDVHFPHKRHQKMRCKRCHHQIHARELDTPHEEYFVASWIQCQGCHDEHSEFGDSYFKCSGCHHAEPESIIDETISSKVVIHESCWKCHKSGTGVTASEGCSYCHQEQE
jgi:hypothetical protein